MSRTNDNSNPKSLIGTSAKTGTSNGENAQTEDMGIDMSKEFTGKIDGDDTFEVLPQLTDNFLDELVNVGRSTNAQIEGDKAPTTSKVDEETPVKRDVQRPTQE